MVRMKQSASFNQFATSDAYMRQLFHCLQWYAGSERVKEKSENVLLPVAYNGFYWGAISWLATDAFTKGLSHVSLFSLCPWLIFLNKKWPWPPWICHWLLLYAFWGSNPLDQRSTKTSVGTCQRTIGTSSDPPRINLGNLYAIFSLMILSWT